MRGPPVQFGLQTGRAHPQMGLEDLAEERVEAVPVLAEVLDEGVLAVEPGEDGPGVGALRQRVHQLGAEPVEDTDPQQEVLRLGRLASEHLREQEVGDRGAVGLELLQIELRVRVLLRGEGAQPQSGGPAPGALHETVGRVRRKPQSVQAEELGRLLGGERQLRAPDLGQVMRPPGSGAVAAAARYG